MLSLTFRQYLPGLQSGFSSLFYQIYDSSRYVRTSFGVWTLKAAKGFRCLCALLESLQIHKTFSSSYLVLHNCSPYSLSLVMRCWLSSCSSVRLATRDVKSCLHRHQTTCCYLYSACRKTRIRVSWRSPRLNWLLLIPLPARLTNACARLQCCGSTQIHGLSTKRYWAGRLAYRLRWLYWDSV